MAMIQSLAHLIWGVCVLAAACCCSAIASPIPKGLEPCGQFVVQNALGGDTLTDAEGERLLLSAIKAPEVWGKSDRYGSWPHAELSRRKLEKLVSGQTLSLFCEGETRTYDGKRIAHATIQDGTWLQHVLVEQGLAFVFPRADHITGIDLLLTKEGIARQKTKGLWAQLDLISKATDSIQTGRFKIVRGTVTSAARSGNRIFLNFGDNWRRDFTIEIPAPVLRRFKKIGLDPLTWETADIEVRGWITWKGGPHIMLEGPGQIRLLATEPTNTQLK